MAIPEIKTISFAFINVGCAFDSRKIRNPSGKTWSGTMTGDFLIT
jgi:hypothetical protein